MEHWKNLSIDSIIETDDKGNTILETWAFIQKWDQYMSSTMGRVKSVYRVDRIGHARPGRIMKQFISAKGYCRVCLTVDNVDKKFQVHRLVALTFLENKENKPHVNHLKGDKTDNRASELAWATRSEDEKHSYLVLGKKANRPWLGKSGKDHFASIAVTRYSISGKIIDSFGSLSEASRYTGTDIGGIRLCIKGKQACSNGFIWKQSNK